MSVFAGPDIVTNGLAFCVDFANNESVDGTDLIDMSANKIPVTTMYPEEASVTIDNGYATFAPSDETGNATHYKIGPSAFFNNMRAETSFETCMYITDYWGNYSHNRGVSPRVAESSSPYGFSYSSTTAIAAEINTSNGWDTASNTSCPDLGFNKWVYISQTTSESALKFYTYVNGKMRIDNDFTGTVNWGESIAGFLLGRGYYGGITNCVGRIAFLRVYDRPLTSDEVAQNFQSMRKRFAL